VAASVARSFAATVRFKPDTTPVVTHTRMTATNTSAFSRVRLSPPIASPRQHQSRPRRGWSTSRPISQSERAMKNRSSTDFWINPSNGSVLISELMIDSGGVLATVTVSYQSEPLMGFLVPVEMRESYVRRGERISGHATYGKFRPIEK